MKQSEVNKYLSRLDRCEDLEEFECSEPEQDNNWVDFKDLDEDYLEYLNDIDLSEDA